MKKNLNCISIALMVLFIITGSVFADLNAGLVAYYPFNGNANDESGNGNDGTVYGATLTTDRFDNPNSAYSFDGVDDYIHVNHSSDFESSSITAVTWIKVGEHGNRVISKHSGSNQCSYFVGATKISDSNWNIRWYIFSTSYQGRAIDYQTNLKSEDWYCVSASYDGSVSKLYLNGSLVKDSTFNEPRAITSVPFLIGKYEYDPDNVKWDGKIDDVRVYNRALTESEIDSLYHLNSWSVPDMPQNLTVTPGNRQVTLRWDANTETGLHKYNIYRNTSSPATTLIDSCVASSPPDSFYVDTDLTNGETYYYRVTAVDDTGNESGFSNEVSSSPTQFHVITTGPFVNDVGVGGGGLSWGDYDNDGDLDLFAASGVHNNVLYNNDGNGSLTEVTTGPIVTEGGHSIGGSWGDYDNDGYLDLFVANEVSQVNFLYHNNGDGTFSKVTTGHIVTTGVTSYGGSWADYDNDGDIDLFVANVGLNYLYKNDGVGNFSLVTDGSVVTDGPSTHSTTGSWADYNNDRYLDLFVTNGGGENNFLYMNNGDTTFTKITSGAVVTDGGGSYCGSWADYNNDGYLDLFVVNALDEDNFLYENNKDGTFTKVTDGSVVSDGGWSHGCGWADYNNDGYIDLFVANFNYDNNFSYEDFLYTNNGDGTFTRLAAGPIVADSSNSIGVAWADYDKDGDLDLFITGGGNEENLIYINDGTDNNWININALGINNAPSIGARVRIKALLDGTNSTWQMQEIASLTSYGSHGSFNAEFGLGVATIIDSIIIKWPSGIIWDSANVNVNQFITVYEPNQQSGLIAYYPFNGNANDESGNGNDGTVNGATLTTDRFGNANSAYSFDGVDDYIISEIGNIGTMGLSFWYKSSFPDPDVEWPHFFWYNNSYCCMYSFSKPGQEGYIYSRKQLADNSGYHVVTDYSPLFDTWHHVFVQYDSTNNNLKLYIDGTNMFNGIYTNDGGYHPISQNDTIYWGYWGAPLNLTSFKGSLDDIIIFNCILDSATIDSLYHVGSREENIIITVDSLIAFIGDTVSVPINVGFFTGKYYDSAELKFSGYQNGLEFIGVDTSSSMTGGAGWSNAVNETGDSLIISWFAGAEDISGSGVFCRLKFVATGEPCNFVPINIESALFNTGGDPVSITNGGVYIKPIPFYGDVDSNGEIQAHDAALTLKHVIEVETLDCQGLANADVTLNDTVTALDASIILQYGVGLIDSLPYDTLNGNLLAKGSITMKDGNYVPGQVVEVPLTLSGGSNILSFEGSLSYRPEQLVYSDIEWSHVTEGFLIEVNESDGKLVFAGAGSAPDGESGVFATVRFVINASFSGGETTVSLDELRWNEGAVKYDVAVSTLSRVAAIDFDISGIPAEYSLSQNYPNPFNPVTTIQYAIPEKSHVTLTIYNIAGQALEILENQLKEPGYYSVQWDASKIGSGVYIYEIQADEFRSVKKCVILK